MKLSLSILVSGIILVLGALPGSADPVPIPYYQEGYPEQLGLVKSDTAVFEVPFRYSPKYNAILVDLRLNGSGTAYPFLLDTGASVCSLDDKLAELLSLRKGIRPLTIYDINNNRKTEYPYYVDHVNPGTSQDPTVGPEVRNVPFLMGNPDGLSKFIGTKIYGVIGMNLLRPFKITIDNLRKVLVLRVDNSPEVPGPGQVTFQEQLTNAVRMPMQINGADFTIQVDTGNLSDTVLPDSVIDAARIPPTDVASTDTTTYGIYGAIDNKHVVRLPDVTLGSVHIDYLPAVTQDSPIPSLNQDFLRHCNITVDFYNHLVGLKWNCDGVIVNNWLKFGYSWDKVADGLKVAKVLPEYQATLGGLSKGDIIIEAEGASGDQIIPKLVAIKADNRILEIHMKVRRDGQELALTMHKRWLFPPLDQPDPVAVVTDVTRVP